MTKYVALLRGISPLNPNMRNHKLREVFENLGFTNVKTVISSGNVVFETTSANAKKMESTIQKAIKVQLGFTSTTIIRSQQQLQAMIKEDPFSGLEHTKKTNLAVTFLQKTLTGTHTPPTNQQGYEVVAVHSGEIYSIVDLTSAKTPQLMTWLEKEFGKDITTRTWQTVQRIVKAFES